MAAVAVRKKGALAVWWLVWWGCMMGCGGAAGAQVRIGFLSYVRVEQQQPYSHPLDRALTAAFPGHEFEVMPMWIDELAKAAAEGRVDYVLTNSSQYVLLQETVGLSQPLARLVSLTDGEQTDTMGGAVLYLAGKGEVRGWRDLRGKRVAVVGTENLVGYQAQVREAQAFGLRPGKDYGLVVTGKTPDRLLECLRSGEADVAFARAGFLEYVEGAGLVRPGEFGVMEVPGLPSFPARLSTRLYPEGAFGALPHADKDLTRRITSYLLDMWDRDRPLAEEMMTAGFTVPARYDEVERLMRDLRLPPFDKVAEFTVADIWERYRLLVVCGAGLLGLLAVLTLRLLFAKRELEQNQESLLDQQQRLKESEDYLRLNEERQRMLTENANDVIWRMTLDGRLLYVSPAVERLRGWPADEAVRHAMDQILTPSSQVVAHDYIRRLSASVAAGLPGEVFRGELEYLHRDGSAVWTEVVAFPFRLPDGSVEIEGLTRSIDERKRYEEGLLQAREAAESANRAKTAFLANMSHEIRTPMNGIVGMAQLLEMIEVSAEQREYLDVIRSCSDTLLSLINDVLDISRIESGRFELERVEFGLRGVMEEVLRTQSVQAGRKRLAVQLAVAEEVPERLCGDPLRFKQVMMNLVGNAVKFTDAGEVRVEVRVGERVGGVVMLEVVVRDTGIGMAAGVVDRVFEPFMQADASTTRKYGGTGLGLPISRGLVELMGGRIEVESREGEGSLFRVRLPFLVPGAGGGAEVGPVVHADGGKAWAMPGGPSLRVLVVDDQESNLLLARRVLEKMGHRVLEARDGLEAVRVVDESGVDFVLMDIHMPVMNGLDAVRAIRMKEVVGGSKLPVVALTARALESERSDIMEHGFDGYLCKPLEVAALVAEMDRCLTRGKS